MLTALRAFACGTCLQYSRRDGDGKETDNSQNQSYRGVTSILIRIVYHTAVKAGAYGTYACHHTRIPVAVFQVRNHVSCLNTFADGIGQVSFQTVSGIKLDAALVGYQQDNQSVILPCLPTPHSLSNRCEKSKQSSLPMEGTTATTVSIPVCCSNA